ncbi:hypothetical protein [Saccharopolyspora shandongensis]|uniref:hypothetical protein n=1 Tax=Saccharopolyspora shandongensis TaxID=418495 RepID=UPI0033C37EAE
MTAGLTFPAAGTLVQYLTAAKDLVPESLLHDSGQADELADEYNAIWLDTLHFIGHWAEEAGRDGELPTDFWMNLVRAARTMAFSQFVPYCLGKAKGLPRQDAGDLMAAFSMLPSVVEVPEKLRECCLKAAGHIRDDDPFAAQMLDTVDLDALAEHLRAGAYDRLGEFLSELFSDVFDDLFELVTRPDFPAEQAKYAWAVIGPNPFRLTLGNNTSVEAEPWWRAI